jgi:Domain of unknown function (DUF1905)/Bacteriocin-protection, YdeI or OmpD-Associated
MKPIVEGIFVLEKFDTKGGWTYVALPEVKPNKTTPFGWRKVKGSIDGYAIEQYHLMPMGNGSLFLPVKASIRKIIGKQRGDRVSIVLFVDDDAMEIPEDILLCIQDEPEVKRRFYLLREGERRRFVLWITSAKRVETRANRIGQMFQMLLEGRGSLHDPKIRIH